MTITEPDAPSEKLLDAIDALAAKVCTREWILHLYDVFIERGFVSIQARLDFFEAVYGPTANELDIQRQLHFADFKKKSEEVTDELSRSYIQPGIEPPLELFEQILSDPALCVYTKGTNLRRLFPQRWEEYIARFEPLRQRIEEAEMLEERTLSKLWGDKPAVQLYDKDKIPLRKAVYNSVIADAFAPFGFVKRRRKRGLDVLQRLLNARYEVVIDPDPVTFLFESYDRGRRNGLQLSLCPCLSEIDPSGRKIPVRFSRPWFSNYAIDRSLCFHDTRSLEVAIRALALSYEVLGAPFDEIVRELG